MAPAGWKNRLKEIEKLKDLLLVDANNVEAHKQVASAWVVADSKNKLLVSVKEIGGNGKAELIVALEKALVKHDLEFYARGLLTLFWQALLCPKLRQSRHAERNLVIPNERQATPSGAVWDTTRRAWPVLRPSFVVSRLSSATTLRSFRLAGAQNRLKQGLLK